MKRYQICNPTQAGATTYSLSAVRAFSRLSQVWLTFRETGPRSIELIRPGPLRTNAPRPANPWLSLNVRARVVNRRTIP